MALIAPAASRRSRPSMCRSFMYSLPYCPPLADGRAGGSARCFGRPGSVTAASASRFTMPGIGLLAQTVVFGSEDIDDGEHFVHQSGYQREHAVWLGTATGCGIAAGFRDRGVHQQEERATVTVQPLNSCR